MGERAGARQFLSFLESTLARYHPRQQFLRSKTPNRLHLLLINSKTGDAANTKTKQDAEKNDDEDKTKCCRDVWEAADDPREEKKTHTKKRNLSEKYNEPFN